MRTYSSNDLFLTGYNARLLTVLPKSVIKVADYSCNIRGLRTEAVTAQNDNMIPLAILTGYLGAGKTTLLNRVLSAEHGLRIAILVNDFGAINMDTRLIVGVEGDSITLSNGCTCYTIQSDFITTIARIIDSDNPPDFILFESNGLTDPAKLLLSFNRSILRNRVRIDSIIAVVDTEQFKSLDTKPKRLIQEQIRVSDIVILNKADLSGEETMREAHQWVDSIIDKARIIEADYCDVPIDSLLATATYNPQTAFDTSGPGVHAHSVDELDLHQHNDRSLVFATWVWEAEGEVVLGEMRRVLDTLPGNIFRAKGVIYAREVPDKQIELQLVGNRVSLSEGDERGANPPKNQIVLIGDIPAVDKIALKEAFEATLTEVASATEEMQLVDGVMKWTRLI